MEYVKVRRTSEDVETLDWLGQRPWVGTGRTTELVQHLSKAIGVKAPSIEFYRLNPRDLGDGSFISTESGRYWADRRELRVAKLTNIETVVHEMAHHYVHEDIKRYSDPGFKGNRRRGRDRQAMRRNPHGWDFTWRLDKLAKIAREYITEQRW